MQRISGLDSLRFICAIIVFVGHLGGPMPAGFDLAAYGLLGQIIASSAVCLFNGPAAVIVFFLISGFCIHYPQSTGRPLVLRSFYLRRFTRIGVPAILAWVLYLVLGFHVTPPEFGVLWSIICEAIYYLLYPFLLALAQRYSWRNTLVLASASALVATALGWPVILRNPSSYVALGSFTWVVGLPSWILGCRLAEYIAVRPAPIFSANRVWLWRLAVVVGAFATRVLKFHASPPWGVQIILLTAFAPLAYLWLREEIFYFQSKPPHKWLEAAGAWSYSLYLIHIVAINLGNRWLGAEPSKVLIVALGLALAYGFYLVVERSSHHLARKISV
jgi:peptidoglycan/LPS O-acetylase OafA/YrhL